MSESTQQSDSFSRDTRGRCAVGGLPVDSRVQYITERRSESCCVCGRGQGVGVKGDRALSQNSPQSSVIDTCHIFVSFISKTRGSRSRRVCLRRARHSHFWPDGARRRHVSVFNALSRPLQPSECGQAVLSVGRSNSLTRDLIS